MSKQRAPYPAWIYRQSALVPYHWDRGDLHVLLITSRSGKRWVVPKGIVEPGMSPIASALKEAYEEAGVTGRVHDRLLGRYRQNKWGGTCEIAVYPLEVTDERDDWPEAQSRERRWFPVSDAARLVGRRGLRRIIERLQGAVPEPDAPTIATETAPPARTRLIHLFRHAKSSRCDPNLADQERPLAPRGERACEAMSRYMSLADVHPDLVLCSSAVRTRQTLEHVMPALGEHPQVQHSSSLYLAEPRAMLDRLRRCPEDVSRVMVVGHNPGLQELAIGLVRSGDSESPAEVAAIAAKFPTGALAILVYHGATWAELDAGSCELHSFVSPREIGEAP